MAMALKTTGVTPNMYDIRSSAFQPFRILPSSSPRFPSATPLTPIFSPSRSRTIAARAKSTKEKVVRGPGVTPNMYDIRSSAFQPGYCAFPSDPYYVDRCTLSFYCEFEPLSVQHWSFLISPFLIAPLSYLFSVFFTSFDVLFAFSINNSYFI